MGNFLTQLSTSLGLGAMISALIVALFNRGRTRSESEQLRATAANAISDAAGNLAEHYTKLNTALEQKLTRAETALETITQSNIELNARCERITKQLEETNHRLLAAVRALEDTGHDVTAFWPITTSEGGS